MLACLLEPMKPPTARADVAKAAFCDVKRRLMESFIEAVREMNVIENQQIEAIIEGDPDFSRFDLLLHFALEKKDTAKYAWIAHVESHSC